MCSLFLLPCKLRVWSSFLLDVAVWGSRKRRQNGGAASVTLFENGRIRRDVCWNREEYNGIHDQNWDMGNWYINILSIYWIILIYHRNINFMDLMECCGMFFCWSQLGYDWENCKRWPSQGLKLCPCTAHQAWREFLAQEDQWDLDKSHKTQDRQIKND